MKKSPVSMRKSPVPINVGALRDAVKRKSVNLSFTTNFNIFGRSGSGSVGNTSGGEDDEERSGVQQPDGDDDQDDQDMTDHERSFRSRENSAEAAQGADNIEPSPAVSKGSRHSYVEPPEPPLPPPGGLLEAATKNVQAKMKDLTETFHEVTTSLVRSPWRRTSCLSEELSINVAMLTRAG